MRKTILTAVLLLLCGGLCWAGSFEDTRRAAEQGDAEAQFNLGVMLTVLLFHKPLKNDRF